MYKSFYGLTQRPFSKTPDPKFLFMSRFHEEALMRLMYAVEEKDMILLTGDVGCGKTTLTRALIDQLDDNHRIILIINPRLTAAQFLIAVAKRFGIDTLPKTKQALLDLVYEKVYEDYENGITPVIIIDESQLVPDKKTFEEIRLLTNFQLDDTNLMSVVMVGQSDLRDRLNHKAYMALRQRIGLFYHLGPLAEAEVKDYLLHRLKVAGRKEQLFTDGAIKKLFKYSGGIPRVINSLATMSLLEGFGSNKKTISDDLIASAAKELGLDALMKG